MIKKTITYDDLDGNKKSEDFWFQITQAEFLKKAMTEGGEAYLDKLRGLANLDESDMVGKGKEIMSTFETLLGDGVGRREGDLFIKNDEIKNRFMYSGAYDAFFMELIQSPDSGAIFMRNMLPRDAHEAIDKALAERNLAQGETASTGAEPPESGQVSLSTPIRTPELTAAAPQLAEARKDDEPAWLKEQRYPTQKELIKMSQEELQLAMRMKTAKAFG